MPLKAHSVATRAVSSTVSRVVAVPASKSHCCIALVKLVQQMVLLKEQAAKLASEEAEQVQRIYSLGIGEGMATFQSTRVLSRRAETDSPKTI